MAEYVKANVIDDKDGQTAAKENPGPVTRVKGVAQMAAGAGLGVAGVAMLVLPGPGIAALAGAAALTSVGFKNATGKTMQPPNEDSVLNHAATFASEELIPMGKQMFNATAAFAAEELLPVGKTLANDAWELTKEAVHVAGNVIRK